MSYIIVYDINNKMALKTFQNKYNAINLVKEIIKNKKVKHYFYSKYAFHKIEWWNRDKRDFECITIQFRDYKQNKLNENQIYNKNKNLFSILHNTLDIPSYFK